AVEKAGEVAATVQAEIKRAPRPARSGNERPGAALREVLFRQTEQLGSDAAAAETGLDGDHADDAAGRVDHRLVVVRPEPGVGEADDFAAVLRHQEPVRVEVRLGKDASLQCAE